MQNCQSEVLMTITAFQRLLLSGLLLSSSLAVAQPVSNHGTAVKNPAEPSPFQLLYFSVFTRYQPFREQPLSSWKETNDTVGKIGGWRFYARDAQQPETGSSPNGSRPDPEKMQPSGSIERSDQHSGHGRNP
jgi:hypothetical protein